MVNDPECGMKMEKEAAVAYEDKIYYFCSSSCHKKFNVWPQYYIQDGTGETLRKGTGDSCGG
tara:strand:- start:3798 stop:3983 length:186 start_codon:yes stop_codon:yes gene_type:complete